MTMGNILFVSYRAEISCCYPQVQIRCKCKLRLTKSWMDIILHKRYDRTNTNVLLDKFKTLYRQQGKNVISRKELHVSRRKMQD